jgi:ribosomal protein S12 methylthiotransferase
MLTLMRRETDGNYIRNLVKRMREGIPGLAIRTTFIVGFPGETEADFEELVQFIDETKFERAGVFNYSKEEGTRAYKMEGHIHHSTRQRRWNEAMSALQNRAEEFNASMVGKTVRVLVEKPGEARTYMDAPDIDGTVFVDADLPVGEFADVTIQDWRGYDLVAKR